MEQAKPVTESLEELTKKLVSVSPTQWSKYEVPSEEESKGWVEYSATICGRLITIGKKKPETHYFKAIIPDDLDNGKVTGFEITVPITITSGTYRLGIDRSKWYEEKREENVLEDGKEGIGEIFEKINGELKGYQ